MSLDRRRSVDRRRSGGSDGDVQVRYTKWGARPHWTLRGFRLGEDEHGVWVGAPRGTVMRRPGVEVVAARHHAMLFPRAQPWTAAFYQRLPDDGPEEVAVYVDITTVPVWGSDEVTMVDLDLDVVQVFGGAVHVDDEDEFAEHQVALSYPPEIVALASQSCAEQEARVRAGEAPYGDIGAAWVRRVADLAAR
jgi:protein associated with RNAse G/E